MALFLVEFHATAGEEELGSFLDDVAARVASAGGEVIESQVGRDLGHIYVVVEHAEAGAVERALVGTAVPFRDVASVRLVGSTPEEVRAARGSASYLVEWDLPADLTMERYLERKRRNAVHYANVPEVRFLRTYVREDMEKCLCLYDAPDEDCVRRARDAVSAPVDRLTRLEPAE